MTKAALTSSARLRVLALTLVGVLALAACGARIDTTLTLEEDGSGERVMTLTLEDDLEEVIGGADAVHESIVRHKPDNIEYSGVSTGEDGELIATLTVPFDSTQDYLDKMASLMNASDKTWDGDSTVIITDNPFGQGVAIDESFYSSDILGWLFSGLLADGVVASSNSSNMFENGETTVKFGGIEYEARQPIRLSEVTDQGFDSVRMATNLSGEDISRTITFVLAQKAAYDADPTIYDEHFANLEGAGFDVVQDADSVGLTWDATVTSSQAEDIATATGLALMSEETVFTVSYGAPEEGALSQRLTVENYATCVTICSQNAPHVSDRLTLQDGYELVAGIAYDSGEGFEAELYPDAEPMVWERSYAFSAVTVDLSLGEGASATWVGTFTLGQEESEAIGEATQQLLTPDDGVGTIDVSTQDGSTTYTVTISGGSATEFSERYAAWSERSHAGLTVTELDDHSFLQDHYRVYIALPLSEAVLASAVGVGTEVTVTTPWPQTFQAENLYWPSDGLVDGSSFTFETNGGVDAEIHVKGFTLVGLLALGLAGLLILAVVVFLVVFRKRIGAARKRRQASKAQNAPAQAPTDGTTPGANQGPSSAVMPASPSGTAGTVAPPGAVATTQAPVSGDVNEADYL